MSLDKFFADHIRVMSDVKDNLVNEIQGASEAVLKSLTNGGKVIFMGNGGSASDAQHLSAEFVGRFVKERKPLAAISLATDTSALTAIGNDYGYEQIFSRQLEAIAKEGDVVIGISTSGNSENVFKALETGRRLKCFTIGLLGKDGGKCKSICDIDITINSDVTARIQEAHIFIGHILCELIDNEFN